MSEVLAAPRVMTGDETVIDGAVVVGDTTVDWAGPAEALPAEHAGLPRTDYPGSTIMPGLIDCHVHLGFDGGRNPAARMRSETDQQQLVLMLRSARELLGVGVTTWPWSCGRRSAPAWPAARGSSSRPARSRSRAATAGSWAAKPTARTTFAGWSALITSTAPT